MMIFVFIFRYAIPILCKKCIKTPTSISIEHHYLSAIILISHFLFKNIAAILSSPFEVSITPITLLPIPFTTDVTASATA